MSEPTFLEEMDEAARAGLAHALFAEREAAHVPEAVAAAPRAVEAIGVVGGGTMGAGIAVAALRAGCRVGMVERDDAGVARGRANVEAILEGLVARQRLSAGERDAALARFGGSADTASLRDADLVIEAAFEDMAVKQAVFAELDRVCRPGAILATNTSYLDVGAIAAGTSRPADVIGLHFFSPAHVMKLLEIVVPAQAGADVVASAFALAKRLGKIPVRAGVCDGFIGNRMLAAYRQAANVMMEDGASPYAIDAALRRFGFPIGPFQVYDLAGGDINWAMRKRQAATRDPRARYVQVADRLCERGWFGQKTGRGWYRYAPGGRAGTEDPEVLAIVESERARAGVVPRTFGEEEIVRRCMAAMVNEGANIVHEGIALRPLDVDVVLLHGYGFPRHRGGPMHYGDAVGLAAVLADIRSYARDDPLFWRPSPLLVQLAGQGRDFASLNRR
ncbi:Enoyl-CoA hydratase / Delta(3)-cis-delta(2)-trans-enoyl-CoA isomerase / 3-hydroxyacyl-CoA dehydrogenase/ 3-hydroxybutyryl-CoA epimerase OS=Castellaniella defragrans(strain DSM / CCUG 39792 / 65Phen) OX=1437824 GN=BN940_15376 PE=3 SV=1 [Castellaniella denitrificans]